MITLPRGVRLLQIALLLFGAALLMIVYRNGLDDTLAAAPWSISNKNTLSYDASSYSHILGDVQDPGRLYYPPTSNSLSHRTATYALAPDSHARTPLFIGFTNNNAMLYQCVLSYIAAGWPPSDIIVVENTGTMDSNPLGKLPRNSYFFLDYAALHSHGVAVLQTPTLFNFAQLQNFYIRTALAQGWKNFFWSHMDVLVLGEEEKVPFRSFYQRILDVVETHHTRSDWAIKWFSCSFGMKACDMLVWVSVPAWQKIGAWDTFIPYYSTDCDAFSRMVLNGYPRDDASKHEGAGYVYDVRTLLDKPDKVLFPENVDEEPNSARYQRLKKTLEEMEGVKLSGDAQRNEWQEVNAGRKQSTKNWNYDPKAFRAGWWSLSDAGRSFYNKKWGTDACELDIAGTGLGQMWDGIHNPPKGDS